MILKFSLKYDHWFLYCRLLYVSIKPNRKKESSFMKDLDFAALLCSRLCHDLISPVGAISNGIEILSDEDEGLGDNERIMSSADGQTIDNLYDSRIKDIDNNIIENEK